MKSDFEQMSRTELRTYILEHREDEEAFQLYMNRLDRSPDRPVFPAPQSIEELSHFAELLEQYRQSSQGQN
jgi:hypothetical protein